MIDTFSPARCETADVRGPHRIQLEMSPERWNVLQPLLDRALALSGEQQAAWLDELATSAPDLAVSLNALLHDESAANEHGFLAAPVDVELSTVEIGAYTLECPIGQGGMGSVWLARRTDGRFEGRAAVKLLNLALLTATGRARFRREGSLLARLTHPGIARLLDAGVSANGQPYLVLEYVDGSPIDVFANTSHLDAAGRVRLFLQVLAAVGHAHANLVVHRDLKPNNILVTHEGKVKLLDFGIAKLIDAEGSAESSTITMEGGRALTPEYAAPEQVRGDTITTATDVYSLGTLLYLLVSGRHPTAENCRTTAETLRRLLEVEPARIGLGDLDTILIKALRKEPRDRYQTVAAFSDDLERYLRHEPVGARADSFAYRTHKFLRRHRAGAAVATLFFAALTGATIFSARQMQEARRQRDAAIETRNRADAEAEFQSGLMSQIGERPITMRELLDRGRVMLERQYAGDKRFLAAMLDHLATRYMELGNSKAAAPILARAESLAVAGNFERELANTRCDIAGNDVAEDRYDDARRRLASADSLLLQLHDPDLEAACLQVRADLDMDTKHPDDAVTHIQRAIAVRDSIGRGSPVRSIDLLSTLAEALDSQGQSRQSIATYRRSLNVLDSNGRRGMMERNIIAHNMGVALYKIGETTEAEPLLAGALKQFGAADTSGRLPSWPLSHYSYTALYENHLDSAFKYFDILRRQAVADHDRRWESVALFGLVQTEVRLGHLAEARQSGARLRAIGNDPRYADAGDQLVDYRLADAWLAVAAGDPAAAYATATRVLRERGFYDGKRMRFFHVSLMLAADAALAIGKPADALLLARGARENAARDALAETHSGYLGEARLMEARAQLALRDTAAARASIESGVIALRNGAGTSHPLTVQADSLRRMFSRSTR